MTNVYWLEQAESDVAAENDWFSPSELVRLNSMRFPRRRAEWRLGRWTAKNAVAAYLGLPADAQGLAALEIRAAPSGAPEVFVEQRRAAVAISLSHRAGLSVCVVAPPEVKLGCDLEVVEPRSDSFVADYFTLPEQVLVAMAWGEKRHEIVTLLWSGKESALKALQLGLRADTRSVIVNPEAPGDAAAFGVQDWHPMQVCCSDGQLFCGWWQRTGFFLKTVVACRFP